MLVSPQQLQQTWGTAGEALIFADNSRSGGYVPVEAKLRALAASKKVFRPSGCSSSTGTT
jgi:hypothetical protein